MSYKSKTEWTSRIDELEFQPDGRTTDVFTTTGIMVAILSQDGPACLFSESGNAVMLSKSQIMQLAALTPDIKGSDCWRDPPDTLTIWVLNQNGDLPFIYAAEGRMTDDVMTDIKNQLSEECEFESTFPNGDGEYMFTATFEPAQTGEYGRIEWQAYWEFGLVSFRAIEAGDE